MIKTTIGEVQKEYGVVFEGINPRMNLSTYFKRRGFNSLGKAFDITEEAYRKVLKRYVDNYKDKKL